MPSLLARRQLSSSSNIQLCSRTPRKQRDRFILFYFIAERQSFLLSSSSPTPAPTLELGKIEAVMCAFFLFIASLQFINGVKMHYYNTLTC